MHMEGGLQRNMLGKGSSDHVGDLLNTGYIGGIEVIKLPEVSFTQW